MALPTQPPNALPAPTEDGLRVPRADAIRRAVVRRFGAFLDVHTTHRGPRACLVVSEDFGCERECDSDQLYWSPSLLAAQARRPFERIVVCTSSRQASLTLIERVKRQIPDLGALALDVNDGDSAARVRKTADPLLIAFDGWTPAGIAVAKSLLPRFAPHRSATCFIDANVSLELVGMLVLHERVDVVATTKCGAPAKLTNYLTSVCGLNAPPANMLAPLTASTTAFAASTVESAELWARLRADDTFTGDEFFFGDI